jgi:hypothetical protein
VAESCDKFGLLSNGQAVKLGPFFSGRPGFPYPKESFSPSWLCIFQRQWATTTLRLHPFPRLTVLHTISRHCPSVIYVATMSIPTHRCTLIKMIQTFNWPQKLLAVWPEGSLIHQQVCHTAHVSCVHSSWPPHTLIRLDAEL